MWFVLGLSNDKHRNEPDKSRMASSPGDAPVGLDLEDSGIVCVVELDLWVPQLGGVDVHHDWSCSRGLSCRGHAHYLLVAPPDGRQGVEGGGETLSGIYICRSVKGMKQNFIP